MIVVFVVDTSPSMAAPSADGGGSGSGAAAAASSSGGGISRLDAAKMSIENLARGMDRRVVEHNRSVLSALMGAASAGGSGNQQQYQQQQRVQDVGRLEQFDEFLLLSTSLQPDATTTSGSSPSASSSPPSAESTAAAAEAHASCGAGGRLLVGPVEEGPTGGAMDGCGGGPSGGGGGGGAPNAGPVVVPHPPDRSDFERELKRLRPADIRPEGANSGTKFPEWAGGARGLNAALSHGLGLLSRYRLTRGRAVEHFGMGRLPWTEHQMVKLSKGAGDDAGAAATGAKNESPLQPACLVLLTDGECLRLPPEAGGGKLSLRFGNMPLRDFYKEPFRWDQRIFILHVAEAASAPPLHKDLRALCEVTGGAYMRINPSLPSTSKIMLRIAPPKPKVHSIPDPLRLPSMPIPARSEDASDGPSNASSNVFINGGPVSTFQCLEGGGSGPPSVHRAMILFAGACEQQRWILGSEKLLLGQTQANFVQSPIWCIPESHFPSKKLDKLPPRRSQPLLHYSRNYQAVGSPLFDPYFVMKALHHLDHLQVSIRQLLVDAGDSPPPIASRMLQRDVYICDWVGGVNHPSGPNDPSNSTGAPRTMAGREHFPVCVLGAGRPTLSGEGGDNILNIGILRCPPNWVKLIVAANNSSMVDRLSTLTLLPPDAHILIPLLIKVAEMELRILKKAESKEARPKAGATAGLIKKKVSSAAAARAIHLDDNWKAEFRAYLFRLPPYYLPAIRHVLRPMLPPGVLSLLNVDASEPLPSLCFSSTCLQMITNGEKAARDGNDWLRGIEQNLRMRRARLMQETQLSNALVSMKGVQQELDFGYGQYDPRISEHQYLNSLRNLPPPWRQGKIEPKHNHENDDPSPISLLPSSCLLPYYESRRRWIFGGTGLATRGLQIEGVNNDGANAHHFDTNQKEEDEPLIALAGCGAHTTNQTSIARMGDFKERLSFAPVSFVDYGGSSAVGGAITTTSDGSPKYSVDDDVLPLSFFDPTTGDFIDSPQARARARLMINFGNPFQEKRGGSVVPEKFSSQRPPLHVGENGPMTPPGSPPHDAYDSHSPIEGEGEAAFTGRPASPSPPRSPRKIIDSKLLSLRKRSMPPPLGGEEKRKKSLPQEGKQSDSKLKPHPPPSASSPQPPPPRPRPPPPKRPSHSKSRPPPPPKPTQAQKPAPKKTGPPKPAPPKRPVSEPSSQAQPHAHQALRHTPQKPGILKPAPPKRQYSDVASSSNTTSGQQEPPQQQQDLTVQLQNPGAKPKIKLAEGWICVWSKSQKRWYFFHTKTNKSVWDPEHIKAPH